MVIPGPHVIVHGVKLPVMPLPSPGIISYIKSSKHFTAYETVVNSKNSTNTTFSFSSPKISADGNSSTTRINNNTDRYENMTGIMNNKNNSIKFMINIANSNGTLAIGTDPINFTFDPQSEGRSINGGYEYMWMDTTTLNYVEGEGEGVEDFITGAAGVIALLSYACPRVAIVAGSVSVISAAMASLDSADITSQNTDILYVEAGYWHPYWSWWIYEPYLEAGYYTDEIHNSVYGYVTYIPWTYIPVYTSTGTVDSNTMHTSFFPTWYPSI